MKTKKTRGEWDARKLRRSVESLSLTIEQVIQLIDAEMKKPSSVERGKKIAKIMNGLSYCNEWALTFTLGLTSRQQKNFRAKALSKIKMRIEAPNR